MSRNYFASRDSLYETLHEKIKPNYEVLYDDLRSLDIGSFFLSREFKSLMIENNYYEIWCNILNDVEKTSNIISLITNEEKADSEKAFIRLVNKIDDLKIQNIVTKIIKTFISNSSYKDFSIIIGDIQLLKFSSENIEIIKNVVTKNAEKINLNVLEPNIIMKTTSKEENKKVFIVHGHNDTLKLDVARTLEKLKLQPIILHEQSNNGKTIIEKFEKFSDVAFAIILLTADDLGNSKNTQNLNKRARQNVIFELGYFIGKLGRENVMTLQEEGVETPNDISGVVYTPFDSFGNWKTELAKELKSAGFKIDMNNLF